MILDRQHASLRYVSDDQRLFILIDTCLTLEDEGPVESMSQVESQCSWQRLLPLYELEVELLGIEQITGQVLASSWAIKVSQNLADDLGEGDNL